MTDLDLTRLLAASYTTTPTIQVEDIRLVQTGNVWCVPGTRELVLADWFRDFSALPHKSRVHPMLGTCHDGCLSGAELVVDAFLATVGDDPYVLACHSLGALGVLLAAMATLAGHPPDRLLTCGAMRVSIGPDVPRILGVVPGVHLRHGADPVVNLAPGYDEWRERAQIGPVGLVPSIGDHFMTGYVSALEGLAVAAE